MNNAGRSICVPKASTARIIHFTAQSEDYDQYKKQGYDSDGGLGPFYDAVLMEEEIDDYHEETVVPTDPIDPINLSHIPQENVTIDGNSANDANNANVENVATEADADREGDCPLNVASVMALIVKEL